MNYTYTLKITRIKKSVNTVDSFNIDVENKICMKDNSCHFHESDLIDLSKTTGFSSKTKGNAYVGLSNLISGGERNMRYVVYRMCSYFVCNCGV